MVKGISISLAFLMLITNVGLVHNAHICGGEVLEDSFSLGAEKLSCGMEALRQDCAHLTAPSDGEQHLHSQPCCENEHQLLRYDEDARPSAPTEILAPVFLQAFAQVFVLPLPVFETPLGLMREKAPPLPRVNRQILFQTFLI